jgi:hypothetical protein
MTTYPAILNGQITTAKKLGGRWMIGGDFDTSGSISILMTRDGRPAWFTLKGFVAKFSDYASNEEVEAMK